MIHATIVGNLGKDPEKRNMADGTAVLRLTVASNSRQKVGNEWKSVPTWVSVDVIGKRAESLGKFLSKGSQVAIRGSLHLREYDNRDGSKGKSLDCRADEVELLGSNNSRSGPPQARREQPEFDHDHTYTQNRGGYDTAGDSEDIPF